MMIAYDAQGNVVATLDYVVAHNETGDAIGWVDLAALEDEVGDATAAWRVAGAAGSKFWPEWLGSRALEFRVELDGPPGRKRIARLVHRVSGHVRDRVAIEAAIAAVPPDEHGQRDTRAIVGGPSRPLPLDDEGRTAGRPERTASLPLIGLADRV